VVLARRVPRRVLSHRTERVLPDQPRAQAAAEVRADGDGRLGTYGFAPHTEAGRGPRRTHAFRLEKPAHGLIPSSLKSATRQRPRSRARHRPGSAVRLRRTAPAARRSHFPESDRPDGRLAYSFNAQPGEKVAFVERGSAVDRQIAAIERPHGTLEFTSIPGPAGIRQIVAIATVDDQPVDLQPGRSRARRARRRQLPSGGTDPARGGPQAACATPRHPAARVVRSRGRSHELRGS